MDINENLQSLFSDHNAEVIASKLVNGLNEVIQILLKKKRVQKKNRGVPYWSNKLEKERMKVKELNQKAIETRNIEDIRQYKHSKNHHMKNIFKYQKFKVKENMSKINKRWQTLKEFTPEEDAVPTEILYKGKQSKKGGSVEEQTRTPNEGI